MPDKSNPADKYCRWLLKKYPNAVSQMNHFVSIKSEFGAQWPEWCALPMAATYAMLTNGAPVAQAEWRMRSSGLVDDLSGLTAALIWSQHKMIYRFDTTLETALNEQPADDKLPREALYQMPFPCIYIELGADHPMHGFFAWMECDGRQLVPELRILYLKRGGGVISQPLPLSADTIEGCLQALYDSGLKQSERMELTPKEHAVMKEQPPYERWAALIAPAINRVLYLCSDEPDAVQQPIKADKRHYDRNRRPVEPIAWDVGARMGAAIRQATAAHPIDLQEAREGVHRAPTRPHMRRAHWHHFWRGPRDGKRQLTIKWLPPIPVSVGPDNQMTATIRPVKTHKKKENTDGQ